jgi:hypothetical protein
MAKARFFRFVSRLAHKQEKILLQIIPGVNL